VELLYLTSTMHLLGVDWGFVLLLSQGSAKSHRLGPILLLLL